SASVLNSAYLSGGGGQRVAPVEAENCVRECDFGAGDKRRIAVELYRHCGVNPFSELLAPFRLFARVERMSRRHNDWVRAQMRNERGPLLWRQTIQMVKHAGQEGVLERGKGQLVKQPFREVH